MKTKAKAKAKAVRPMSEERLARHLFNKWAKRNGPQWGATWDDPKPDAVRLSWLDTAADVLKLVQSGRLAGRKGER